MKKIFGILLIILNIVSASEKQSLVSIKVKSAKDIQRFVQQGYDVVSSSVKNKTVDVILNSDQQMQLGKYHSLKIEIPDIQTHISNLHNENYFSHFTSYTDMLGELQKIVSEHPSIASLHDIGDSYMKTIGQGGYDIWALKISDNVTLDDSTETDALFMANIHAREIITPEIIMAVIKEFIDGYETDPYLTHLVNNREMWFIPMLNPDGHEFVFTGDYNTTGSNPWSDPIAWRKNFRDNNNNSIFEPTMDGVDLNRNFGYFWGYDDIGSSPITSGTTYRGTAPFSEPESQAIKNFVEQHDFRTSLSFHSYSNAWLIPWAYIDSRVIGQDSSAFIAMGDSCVAYNNYDFGTAYETIGYGVNGDTDDWFYGEHGIFAYSPEVGSIQQGAFWPDTSLIEPLIYENIGPSVYMAYAAGEEPIVSDVTAVFNKSENSINISAHINQPIILTEPIDLDESTFTLYYSYAKNSTYKTIPLKSNTNSFSAEIMGSDEDITLYYYITASDKIGRTGAHPRGAPLAVDSLNIGQLTNIEQNQQPAQFSISSNYPNPFNGETRFAITLNEPAFVSISIFNALGQKVKRREQKSFDIGVHNITWAAQSDNGSLLQSGLYFAQISINNQIRTLKLLYIR